MTKLVEVKPCPVSPWLTTYLYSLKRNHDAFAKRMFRRFDYLSANDQHLIKDFIDRLNYIYTKFLNISIDMESFDKKYKSKSQGF